MRYSVSMFYILSTSTRQCSEPCMCCTHGLCNDANKCDGCKDGFTGQNCTEPCTTNCRNCSQTFLDSRECFVCKYGYYIGRFKDLDTQPLQKDCSLACKQDCKICSSYSNCTECKADYFLDASNDCKKCPVHCRMCLNETVCLKCDESYFWDKSACRQCMKPCKSCRSSQECDICPDGHLLFKGNCFECLKPCRSCKVIAGREQVCDDCAKGYYMHEHECLKCSKHCTSCLNATNCKMCEHKYKPYKGKCFLCEMPCTSCSSDYICASCQDKYLNLNTKCIMYPKSCFLSLTDIMFNANSSSFLPASSSFVCPDNIDLCKDMYKIDRADNAECLQDMCKLISEGCRNTSLRENTSIFSIPDVNTEDGDNSTIFNITLYVACSLQLMFIVCCVFCRILIRARFIMKKEPNADDIGENDLEDTVGGGLKYGRRTTDVYCETTFSTYEKSKALAETSKSNLETVKLHRTKNEITTQIKRLQGTISLLHEEKAAAEILEQFGKSGSPSLEAILRPLLTKGRNATSLQSKEASAEHRTEVPLPEALKESKH